MEEFKITYIPGIIALFTCVCGVLYFFLFQYLGIKSKRARREEEKVSFDTIVCNLSANDNTTKLAAAIMLRRFLKNSNTFLFYEGINVISSMLKVLPTGILQKTLADGLAYAQNLSHIDLQKTNLQDVYLGRKDNNLIKIDDTDFFLSDLSYALLDGLSGKGIFYRTILFCTQIKNSDLSNSSFREADLTRANFKHVRLKGADFSGAQNVPLKIKGKLVNGIYVENDWVTAGQDITTNRNVFFPCRVLWKKAKNFLQRILNRF